MSATLGDLLNSIRERPEAPEFSCAISTDDESTIVVDATHDSRDIRPGTVFICVRGAKTDGHLFASDAVARGAVALVVDHQLTGISVPQIVVADSRAAMGHIAAAVCGYPADSLVLVGITGTNGKTTTAHMLEQILLTDGRSVRVIGTLTQTRTTPEATELQAQLAEFVAEGVTDVIMEVTSHALELHRVAGIHFRVGVFTNLSQDHLDFHETMEAYFRAKAKLFTPIMIDEAVVNADDTHGRLLRDAATVPTRTYSAQNVEGLQVQASASTFRWNDLDVYVPMSGRFNVANALGAANAAQILGVDSQTIVDGLALVHVPGRYEPVVAGQPFAVIVDFAHTPDGLERVLDAARSSLSPGASLIAVVGCGGDRDRAKRPLMGAIARRTADLAIFTSDNPRSEDPQRIIEDMLEGPENQELRAPIIELDRRSAIAIAIARAKSGDIVVLAGKGHETGQEIAGVKTPFDDRDVARELLAGLSPKDT
jgi:UDP-N-acetylmuramoyl-L-alanyl-D-glutamate--2,6-diaminopimelate ligase